jgi:hypothetical protein
MFNSHAKDHWNSAKSIAAETFCLLKNLRYVSYIKKTRKLHPLLLSLFQTFLFQIFTQPPTAAQRQNISSLLHLAHAPMRITKLSWLDLMLEECQHFFVFTDWFLYYLRTPFQLSLLQSVEWDHNKYWVGNDITGGSHINVLSRYWFWEDLRTSQLKRVVQKKFE